MSLFSKIPLIPFFLLFVAFSVHAQDNNPAFWKDIQAFKKQDEQNPPPQHAILFVGSSSFTKWKDVQTYFPDYKIINRGFGGSTIKDVIRYVEDIIIPYNPKQIIIYAGDNDAAERVSSTEIVQRFKKLYQLITDQLPQAEITYVSIKPSPSREKLFPVMEKANWEIHSFLKEKEHASYVDVWHLMLDDYGKARKELFGEDMLHMNKEGYAIWQKAILPKLEK